MSTTITTTNKRRVSGKYALITGGSTGIGLATAKQFAEEGARVAVTGMDSERLAAAVRELPKQRSRSTRGCSLCNRHRDHVL